MSLAVAHQDGQKREDEGGKNFQCMIRQIDQLRDFGIYRNFQGGGVPRFAKFNLIYGWNYSGKTTLSRLFQILEKPDRLASWPNSAFRLIMDDGSALTHSMLVTNPPPKTRVFNRDFVLANFSQEHTAPAVFILGAQNVALRQRLEMLNHRRERVMQLQTRLQQRTQQVQGDIDQLGTDKARDTGNLLADRNFRRPNLMRRVEEVRQNYGASLLSDAAVTAKLEICRTTSAWATLNIVPTVAPDLLTLSANISTLLGQTASNRAIERLKADRNLEAWVRTGMALHERRQKCEFCGSPISDARLELLRGHFSQEYEALIRELNTKIQECQGLRLDVALPDERDFAPDLKTEFAGLRDQIANCKTWSAQVQARMIEALTQKITQIETALTWEADLSRAAEWQTLLEQVNVVIQRHNQAANELAQAKGNARAAIEKHFAALLFRDNNLTGRENRLAEARQRADDASGVLSRVMNQIEAVELQVRQQSIGAAKLNDVLRFLLAGNNIEVAVVGDGLFEFRRDGAPAANLSDGEKTAIAFAYFLTSLEANGAVLADTIVFIDDPISSLDSNHIYAVYALIAERLAACRQMFVSTHNNELFNLMKDEWFESRQRYANNGNACAYYVNRTLDGSAQWISALEDLPALLRKYKSEYHFVFAQLHKFANAQAPSLHEAYTAPNLLRKFLEAYLGFRKPCVSKWSDKLDLLFTTPEEQREIQKFADDASHLQGVNRALQQPNFIMTAQLCVGKVINGLKTRDFDHYQSLCTVIGAAP
jgi:wobble nucleotide-excising tRNase